MSQIKYSDFRGPAKAIESIDITRTALSIGVGEDEVHAFAEVEANGKGFDSKGRPKALFEPHVFYRNLKGAERDEAVRQGLAYRSWRSGNYPRDSYPRIQKAKRINPEAAMQATSWGRSQVLGENYEMLGYASAIDMVNAFCEDEEHHIQGMIDFCVGAGIDDDLRRLAGLNRPTTADDCRPIVRVYNGPGYAKNNYHVKFARAHNKWRKIKDSEFSQSEIGYPTLRIGSFGPLVEFAQKKFRELDYPIGAIDSDFGPTTRDVVLAFQANSNLPTTGQLDAATWDVLVMNPVAAPISEAREQATVAELREKGSSTIKTADGQQIGGGVLGGAAALAGATELLGGVEEVSGLLDRATVVIEPLKQFLTDNLLLCLGGAAVFMIYNGYKQKKIRLGDHRAGHNKNR